MPFIKSTWKRTGTNVLLANIADSVGIGIATPDGNFHVHKATAGVVVANSLANLGVFENNTSGGISILTPNTSTGSIYFGDASSNNSGRILYEHNNDRFNFFTAGASKVRIDSTGLYSSALTASLPVFSTSGKYLVSNPMTGTGSVVMSVSPTLTGTLAAAAANFSGVVSVNDTTEASGLGSGCAVMNGGLSVGKKAYLGGDVYIGNGTVSKKMYFYDTDYTHGVTDFLPTNVFGGIEDWYNTGSLSITGIGQTSSRPGIVLNAFRTATASGSFGLLHIIAAKKDGADIQDIGADERMVTVGATGSNKFTIYGDGDVVTTGTFSSAGIKSGATQAAAGAAADEIWKTSEHSSLPDNVLLIGV